RTPSESLVPYTTLFRSYDGEDRLISRTDRNGVTVEMGYNLYGAPLFQKAKDGSPGNFYEYTPEGLLKCAISDGMRYAYEYDEMRSEEHTSELQSRFDLV